jgi:hypothetical protein
MVCSSLQNLVVVEIWDLASSAFGFALGFSQARPAAAGKQSGRLRFVIDNYLSLRQADWKEKIHKQTLHIHTRIQPSYFQFRESL